MKRIYISLLFTALLASSCQGDWLKEEPTSGGSSTEVTGTVENSKLSINGMSRIMNMKHAVGSGYNGEGTIMSYLGECLGNDYVYTRYESGFKDGENGLFNTNNEKVWDYFPWTYYYELVMNANALLTNIDNASGDNNEREFIKAQALTFRAHAYSRLVELYGDAWDNSNSGSSLAVVLRTEPDNAPKALSSLKDCYDQIYADLNEAAQLYRSSGIDKDDIYKGIKESVTLPDSTVAHAVFARAALNRKDYSTALSQATMARTEHPLMSVSEYQKGFCTPNSEWIWGSYSDDEYFTDYSANVSYLGYNATDALNRYRAPVANRELIDQFADSDIRKNMFVHKGIYLEDGDNENVYQTTDASLGAFNCATIAGKINKEESSYKAYKKAQDYVDAYAKDAGYNSPVVIFPYTALKFATPSNGSAYNTGCFPFIRSSEMVLIQAEANYFLNKTSDAQANLIELNKSTGRDPEYTCTKTGDELFNEIEKYRRLELWGEGHRWFDCKRWHKPVVRHSLTQGGSFISTISKTLGEDANDTFWKWVIPQRETDYNDMID